MTIHAWKQRALINKAGFGEDVLWYKALRADNENAADNYQNEETTLAEDYPDPGAAFHVSHGWMYERQSVEAPSVAPSAALAGAGGGNLPAGTVRYAFTFVTDSGETTPSPCASVTVVDPSADGQVALSDLAVAAEAVVTARRIYRARVNGAGETLDYRLVAEIPNTGTTYTDNVSADDLGVNPPERNSTKPRVLIQNFRQTMDHVGNEGVSLLAVGNARVAFMREYPFKRGDKFVLLSDPRRVVFQEVITRGADSTDDLIQRPVSSLNRVLQRDARVADYVIGTDCQVNDAGTGIEWLGSAPAEGETYTVEYLYRPTLWFLSEDMSNSHPSADGEGLFRTGQLVMRHPESLG